MSDATTITAAMLAEWRAMCEAATPGPWEPVYPYRDESDYVRIFADSTYLGSIGNTDFDPEQIKANADFVATSREAMPLLLAEVERLRAENQELSEAFDEVVAESNAAVQVAREGRDKAHAMAAERVQSEMARLRAKVTQQQREIMELRTELERSKTQ